MKDLGGTIQLSATDVASLSVCRRLVTLELNALGGNGSRPNVHGPVIMRLIKLGEDHERSYLAKLKQTGRSLEELTGRMTQQEGTARTLDAMKRGVDIIYQGFLGGPGWFGRTDFLVRVAAPSRLGAYSYEVVDTKLSLEAKGRALIQLCLYSQLLEDAQGLLPESMHIILGDGTEERFATRSYLAYFRRVARDVRDAVSFPDAITYPAPIEHCEICSWQPTCDQQLREDDDLSLVAGLTSRHREVLRDSKIATMRALAALSPKQPIEGIPSTSLERIREQARVQCEGRAAKRVLYELLDELDVNRGLSILPEPSPGDLFVDLEGDPLAMPGGLEYLIGVTEAGPTRGRYTAFWGTDRPKEKRVFEKFVRFVKDRRAKDPHLRLYHYAPYEPAAFKRLAARHNTCEEDIDELLRSRIFVDLYRVVRQGLRASVESYSLKKIEALYGFSRKANLKDAGSCLVAMATWLDRKTTDEPDDDLKAVIAAYNEDDCASTLALRDWLEVRRKELETRRRESLSRPLSKELQSEEEAKRITDVDTLERELTQTIPEDAALRTPQQQATWLLAQLLDWHRREDKSTYWEFYRQCDLSDEELIEDSTPLGGLEHLGEVGKEKKSALHRYRFPDQDHGIAQARKLIDPATGKSAGELHELNELEQTITLKRGPSLANEPHPTALVSKDVVDTGVLRDSLMRLGRWIAEHGFDSRRKDYGVERELLLRAPPNVPAGIRMRGASTSEKTSELGKRLALAIEGTVLPVQGPPGAGKTHLGAEMIVALVRAKKRVGIVANSHQVIAKLLKEACRAAEREQTVLRCIQKIEGDLPVHPFVTNVKANAAVLEGLEAGAHVIAGTAWLWSREDMKGVVDVLFVDEAGQLSLANVLASAQGSRGLVLLGDPQQLDQPMKGIHPPGADVSALGHMLGDRATLDDDAGIFLHQTWRMHPDVCSYISEAFYETKLESRANLHVQKIDASGLFGGTGLRLIEVEHCGNTNESTEEAARIGDLVTALLSSGATWTNADGAKAPILPKDVLILTPYNAQVAALRKRVPEGVHVGTVDKFQGQEAPIAIYSLATSSPQDAPRGMEFLYSTNRLNVAVSRARCVSVIVGSPALFRVQCKTPRQMELANALCRFAELAKR